MSHHGYISLLSTLFHFGKDKTKNGNKVKLIYSVPWTRKR